MRKDNLHSTEETRSKLASGINKIASVVGSTMGTGGSNVIIEAIEHPGHLATNDGFTIVKSIELSNPIEEMARKILLEAINRANKASGDGSSTACVLTAAIIEEGMKHTDKHHPMEIKRSLEDALIDVRFMLSDMTDPVEIDSQMVQQVATISAEDHTIGTMIADIYRQIGANGIIHWDISKTGFDTYKIGSGITVEESTYISPYMCDATETGQNTNQIRLKNPKILITKQKITSASDFNNIAAALNGQEIKDLIVFADEIDPLVIGDLIKTRAIRGFRIVVLKMPVMWKDWWYNDLALATGAKVVDAAAGFPMKDVKDTDLGTCENIVVTKSDVYLDGISDLTGYIKELTDEGSEDSLIRASRLNTKTARYYVGAPSDSALSYRRLKVEDAISATFHAINGGVVPGGGVALLSVANSLMGDNVGAEILSVALKKPFLQICENAGIVDGLSHINTTDSVSGFDTRTGKVVDMLKAGIIDPSLVVQNAVENAVSVAATVLTANAIVTLPREEDPFANVQVLP